MDDDLPRRRILVVDDMELSATVLSKLLMVLGQDVDIACDGFTALEKFQQQPFDYVFSDISMPKMDGYQLAEKIRSLPQGKNSVLIALSGHGEPDDIARAQAAGFNRHITKPISIEALWKNLI
jgi:CheY-like chemotaxis protein